jgi:hypothetical protein
MQSGAELLNEGGHCGTGVGGVVGRDALMTLKPASVLGTFRLSEPS